MDEMVVGDGIAIIGMGCRFPGGVFSPDDYWDLMLRRGDGIVEVPADRWNADLYYDPDPAAPGRAYTRHGGFLTLSPWEFDPEFFGISPREAEVMDPQQRWVLEVAWEAIDDAGVGATVSGRNVGVYVGGFMTDSQVRRHLTTARRAINNFTSTGSSLGMLSNRLSYALNLQGPSMTIDTACSSSLVAIHQATRAVASGECEIALAGGVNVMIHPEAFVTLCKGKFLSPDGRCKPFDAAADGYGRGEGAGMIVLKRLDLALRDRDRIYAVIAGTGCNQDGHTMGITVPNGAAQRDLARAVCARAGITADRIGYVEAHGTGTPVGDPIEIRALAESYALDERRTGPLLIGSVKAAIGHLEAAAGVAGVIRAALAVHHRTIPPQARLDTLNPDIPFKDLNVEIVTQATPFPAEPGCAVAAVNGFGYGGTNGHVLLTEAPRVPAAPAPRPSVPLFPLSAASADGVRAVASAVLGRLGGTASIDQLTCAAWSRRAHHPFRTALPYRDATDLARRLEETAGGGTPIDHVCVPNGTKPVFVFSGMGPQWWGMGRELLTGSGPFADKAAQVDAVFTGIAGYSIIAELCRPESESRIQRTEFAQAANFLLQVSLVAELAAMGIEPAAIVGHSVGEVSAAYVSGALGLADAVTVSHHRGRLQATTEGTGGLLAVGLSAAAAQRWLTEAGAADIVIAAVNGPDSVTLAGPLGEIDELHESWRDSEVFVRRLQVAVPYHSPLMDPILDELSAALAAIEPRRPELPLYSTVTAERVSTPDLDARYWCANVRRPVRFADTVDSLIQAGHRVFLEVGPHPVLSGDIGAILARHAVPGASIATLKRGESDRDRLVAVVGDAYRAGCLGPTAPGQPAMAPHVDLPRYPWQHRTLWSEPEHVVRQRCGGAGDRPLLGQPSPRQPMSWSTELSVTRLPWLPDHVVDAMVILPGAAYLDAFLSAAAECTKHPSITVEDVRFLAPLVIDDHAVPTVTVAVEPATMRLTFSSFDDNDLRLVHSTGRVVDAAVEAPRQVIASVDGDTVDHDEFYARMSARGLHYGPAFRRVTEARVGTEIVVTTIDPGPADTGHVVHPALIDAALQGVAAFDDRSAATSVPISVASVRRYGPTPAGPVTAVIRRHPTPGQPADITVTGPDGVAFLELLDVRFAELTPTMSPLTQLDTLFYEIDWRPVHLRVAPARVDRPALRVGIGGRPARAASNPLRPWRRRRDAGIDTMIRPDRLAEAIRAAGESAVTVLVIAGTGDATDLFAGLVEVGRQLGEAAGADADIDAVLVTTGAVRLPGDQHEPNTAHTALAAARRALQEEQLTVRWRHVDLGPGDDPGTLDAVTLNDVEDGDHLVDEIALRAGLPFAPYLHRGWAERLAPYGEAHPAEPETSFVLERPASRLLADLALRETPRVSPEAGQIEVRMDAIGLNYKDSMKVLGVLTPDNLRGTLFGTGVGMEGIGVVARTGRDTGFDAGDQVCVSATDMFRRYLTFDVANAKVVRHPGDLQPGLAGSLVPFVAAEYGLLDTARLRPGETVLVHGGAGGTGLAAIAVARRAGATVIASAGTDERRAFARAAGAHHTVNSRTVNFVDDVMRLTDGRGADVVYTSLAGEALRQNLRAAAEFGRIVDIGKADIYGNTAIELAPFDHNLQYIAVDIDRLFAFRPEFSRRLWSDVISRFADGTYQALPATIFDSGQLTEAFGLVARGTQQGRVVVTLGGAPPVRPAVPSFEVRGDGTYLITGAFGGVGLSVTDWLVSAGAKRLILVSRHGPRGRSAERRIDGWRAAGADVLVETVDIGDPRAVAGLVDRAAAQLPPLRGVFHAAGISEDGAFENITVESLRRVFGAKLDGAWNLHNATTAAGLDLDAFVLFSSVTVPIGFSLQVGYAAANAGLDALAQLRHARGQPAMSINWGVLSGGGMADGSADMRRYLESIGNRYIPITAVPRLMAAVLGIARDLPNVMVANLDWRSVLSGKVASRRSTRFAEFAAAVAGAEGGLTFRDELLALPAEQRLEVLTLVLADQVANVLGIAPDAIDHHTPLPDLGLDSLSSVELSSRIAVNLDIRIPAVDFGRQAGLAAIAKHALAGAEKP